MQEELLDIVNDAGDIIDAMPRSVVHANNLRHFRVVDIFLRNSKGELLILKRARDKKILPGLYECCGEHVVSGETDIAAARRGVREELGLDIPSGQFIFLGYTTPAEDRSWGYSAVFLVDTDLEPQIGREHDWMGWWTQNDLIRLLKKDPEQMRSNTRIHLAKYARDLFV